MNTKIDIIPAGSVTSPGGFSAGATSAGIKKNSALDLGLLFSEAPCTAAGLLTTNRIKAAPVILSQQRLESGKARAVAVNAGCANACTGEQGMADASSVAEMAAKKLGISAEEVLVASTGVIGVNLPMDKIRNGIKNIAISTDGGHTLARAIMTTDTRPKEIAVSVTAGKDRFTIGGIAKGSGMIHPNMATMLCFLTTDASVEPGFLRLALKHAADASLNMVSVDGDTSTNDTVILLANGMAGNRTIKQGSEQARAFRQALDKVCIYLARCIARDGEGATRLIEVTVNGAQGLAQARQVARTITGSPLVKTAVHGCDPNWGRILAAAGRSGVKIVESKIDLYIGEFCLLKAGAPLPFDKKALAAILACEEVAVRLELNLGKASATGWGCDLSEDYVKINAEYTT